LRVHGYFPRATTADASSESAAPTPTPDFSFNNISEMTTCIPTTITWSYTPAVNSVSLNFSLSITNLGAIKPSPPPLTTSAHMIRARNSVSRREIGTESIIAGSIDPSAGSYTWPSVNVSAGWYVLFADLGHIGSGSLSFYVANGTDTSCIRSNAVSLSASSPTSASLATSSPPSGPAVITAAAHGSKVNRGAIAGGVLGGLFILVATISIIFRCRSRTRIPSTPASSPPISPAAATLSHHHGQTVLALDRAMAPGVVASQGEMFEKLARMRESMRILEEQQQGSEGAVDARDGAQDGEEEAAHLVNQSASEPALEAHLQASASPPQPGASSGARADAPDMAQQLRAMAERLALMEAHLHQTHGLPEERPPDYTVGPAL
ncbi:hypothetical protein DFH09DRAFT_1437290, partial [Mycena vulgaris]